MLKGLSLGNRSNRINLLLALTLGLLAAVLTGVYLSSVSKDSVSVDGGSSGGAVPVVVAAKAIPAGTRVTADMVIQKSVSADVAIPQSFTKREDVVGKITSVPLGANEQISTGKLAGVDYEFAGRESLPLDLIVPEGMRAVSVNVSSLIGAGGLIRPGTRVDVILAVKVEGRDASGQTKGKSQVARTVVQNAEVLAVDQTVEKVAPSASSGAETTNSAERLPLADSEPKANATTVTLAVPPVHGEVLTAAETCAANFDGRLSLALRGFGDTNSVSVRAPWPQDGPVPDCARMLGLDSVQ